MIDPGHRLIVRCCLARWCIIIDAPVCYQVVTLSGDPNIGYSGRAVHAMKRTPQHHHHPLVRSDYDFSNLYIFILYTAMDKTIGILGGGQLGRMLTEAANRLNVSVVTLDAGEACPSKQINAQSNHVNGSFNDPRAIHQLAAKCDILTTEIEHVNADVLESISNGTDVEVQPSWRTIQVIKDKYDQKLHLMSHGLAVARSHSIKSSSFTDVQEAAKALGYPLMLKSRTEAYDGRGNFPIKDESEIASALATLKDRPLYAEKWANFTAELAVMVVKIEDDACDSLGPWERATLAYPVTETVQEDSICKLVYAPARNVSSHVTKNAQDLARLAVAGFWGRGVFGVEMFLLENGM